MWCCLQVFTKFLSAKAFEIKYLDKVWTFLVFHEHFEHHELPRLKCVLNRQLPRVDFW